MDRETERYRSSKLQQTCITSYDREQFRKKRNYNVRRIATTGLLGVGLLTAIIALPKLKDSKKIVDVASIEQNLDQNEMEIMDQLTAYSIALQEYEETMSKKNHSAKEEVEKRIELVTQVRNLTDTADFLMKEKTKEAFDLTGTNTKVEIYRENDSAIGPVDYIKVTLDKEEIYNSKKSPTIIREILNYKDSISIYNGSGENTAWEKDIDGFISQGNGLYNAIVSLSEMDLTVNNGNLKAVESEKSM